MIEQIQRIAADGEAAIGAASSVEELRGVEADLLGKRAPLTDLKKQLGGLDPEQRKAVGMALNEARSGLEASLAGRRSQLEGAELATRIEGERLDLTEIDPASSRGHLHLVTQTHERLEDVFVGMGFTVAEGPEVESDWYNFEALNIPAAHPARACRTRSTSTWASPRARCCAPTPRRCRSG